MGVTRALGHAAAIAACAVTHPALAQTRSAEFTGNDLLRACENHDLKCLDFIRGVNSGFAAGLGIAGERDRICFPEGVTLGQAKDVVVAFLRDNPSSRHEEAGALTVIALMRAFPCGE